MIEEKRNLIPGVESSDAVLPPRLSNHQYIALFLHCHMEYWLAFGFHFDHCFVVGTIGCMMYFVVCKVRLGQMLTDSVDYTFDFVVVEHTKSLIVGWNMKKHFAAKIVNFVVCMKDFVD